MRLDDRSILVTGGTGSFGRRFIQCLLKEHRPRQVTVFSRDEVKQLEMRAAGLDGPCLRYVLGDVRNADSIRRACSGVDVIIHAAALKQVSACESNPVEAVMTNVLGAKHVIDAALDAGVGHVLALSTDKAVNPANAYGATKLCAEKMFVHGNGHSVGGGPRFSCVRYGNVVGSRGSVLPILLQQRKAGVVTITDRRMTRFCLTLDGSARFVLQCLARMQGGEVFVPKVPNVSILDLVEVVAPDCRLHETGIRPGEKLHETLISEDEARHTRELHDMFIVQPAHAWWDPASCPDGEPLADGFRYSSDDMRGRLSRADLRRLIEDAGVPH
jgi:UDP-N-acetylglucosamine 4,6-dehydratase